MSALPCVGNCDGSLAKVKENDTHCSPLVPRASHLIAEGSQAGQI